MIAYLCYVVIYYNIDKLLQNLYLPNVIHNNNYELISNHDALYFLLKMTSCFMLVLYSYTLYYKLLISKTNDKNGVALSFIYTKHILDILLSHNYTIMEYELNRSVMWVFTTPLMLRMYCDANDISIWDINIHYHLIAIVPYVFVMPFKNQPIYILSTIVLSIPEIFFLKSLHKYKQLPFTNLYILIWIIFILINILDISQLCSPIIIHAFYNIADTLCKFICDIVIANYNEQEVIVRENMDLQSVQFVSHVIKSIKEFDNNNIKQTPFCRNLMLYCKKKFLDKIPISNEKLKLELLKKLLPFDLDRDYVSTGSGSGSGTGSGSDSGSGSGKLNKEFEMICVMFIDIVNYTELSNRYKNCNTIFNLLNDVYNQFDNIIKKYSHLQKIETIGDAYMVVGDIYREENNHKIVVKEIILLGLEFIKEIKTIKTPDNESLSIRVGINLGTVNIGILGNEIPRLCVVGNAVNVASRLQCTAEPDTIQLSIHVYEQLEEIDFNMKFDLIIKENVFLKNLGSRTTYIISPQ